MHVDLTDAVCDLFSHDWIHRLRCYLLTLGHNLDLPVHLVRELLMLVQHYAEEADVLSVGTIFHLIERFDVIAGVGQEILAKARVIRLVCHTTSVIFSPCLVLVAFLQRALHILLNRVH